MLSNFTIDINADVGEGLANEHLLMPYLSSCNIACGGHAGDIDTMLNVVKLAKTHKVKIGAHPSFPDRLNFGRKILDMSPEDLFESLKMQIEALLGVLKSESLVINHIKPHGALYNLAAKDIKIASIVIEVIKSMPETIKLYAPFESEISKLAKSQYIEVVFEGFADRNYNEDLSLVSRQKPNALITKPEGVLDHVLNMICNQNVRTINEVEKPLFVDTICVHGDTKNAQEILKYLHQNLVMNNIKIS